jgi:hypothetical protein
MGARKKKLRFIDDSYFELKSALFFIIMMEKNNINFRA